MTKDEARAAICAIKIDSPTLIFVDANQVNMQDLVNWALPGEFHPTVIVPVDGPPSVLGLSLEALKDAIKKLEAA